MLLKILKTRMLEAMKAGRTVEKEVLKVVIGEIEVEDARGGAQTEEEQLGIVRKLVKSNTETLGLTTDATEKKKLEDEIAILKAYLPQEMTVDQIAEALAPVRDAVRAAGNDGQATGVAMKHLKSTGASVNGKDVTEAVKRLRA